MTRPKGTSVVEDVGNRVQGNIQTHGESQNSGKGAKKGRRKSKNTHTVKSQSKLTSEENAKRRRRPRSSKNEEARIANRQCRTGQWRLRAGYNSKGFRHSSDLDRLLSEPTYDDLMQVVDKQN